MSTIKPISADETRPLRHAILRPHQTYDQCYYPGDESDDTLHLGAFVNEELVGIVSIFNQAPPEESDEKAWRIRGMAVIKQERRKGHARNLMKRAEQHATQQGASFIWFNAQTSAVPFYKSLGYATEGEEFDRGEVGPQFFMRKYM